MISVRQQNQIIILSSILTGFIMVGIIENFGITGALITLFWMVFAIGVYAISTMPFPEPPVLATEPFEEEEIDYPEAMPPPNCPSPFTYQGPLN